VEVLDDLEDQQVDPLAGLRVPAVAVAAAA
jgi:hypothetical protein